MSNHRQKPDDNRECNTNSKIDNSNCSKLLTVKEAAEIIRVSKSYLDKLRLTGAGPTFHKIGSRVFYDIKDVNAWIGDRRFSSTSEYDREE
jgi:molybdenum cofactor biosynthesis enzyme MoaA